MIEHRAFEFRNIDEPSSAEAHIARVPAGLTGADALLATLCNVLRLPEYFGFNWNALSDCLRDFHWLEEREVVLVHEDIPQIPESDLVLYLDVLVDAVQSWCPEEEHSLRVLFPEQARGEVLRLAAREQ